jgi:hypothetical protein
VDINSLTPEWTGETIATFIAVPLLILGLAVAAYWLRRGEKQQSTKTYGEPGMFKAAWMAALIGIVLAVVGTWWGMYPWKTEYHQWTPVSGVVDTVDSRLLPAGETSVEQKFVVSFRGNPQQYGVLDTRAAGVKPGDRLTITCVRRWQWSGTHGYDCNFVSLERVR